MTIAADFVLAMAVITIWLATVAYLRLHTPFERIHVVTFVNSVACGMIVFAAFLADGVTSRSLKCGLIWLVNLMVGALLSHATGRALHIRGDERS